MKEIQLKKFIFDFLKILFISIFFFLLIDLILGKFIYKKFLRKDFKDTYQDIYIKNSYDHTLKKELDVLYGNIRYRLCTDKNGFRTFCDNKLNDKKSYQIAILGDSFTEGVGLSYEDTFVGIFSKKIGIEKVANLGVSSYSPSIYYLKMRDLLSKNYKFDELIVFVDLSDLVDETLCYSFLNNQVKRRENFNSCINAGIEGFDESLKVFFKNNLRISFEIFLITKNILTNKSIIEKKPTNFQLNTLRSKWSYKYDRKNHNNYSFKQAEKLMTDKMTLLYLLLKKNNISLSIAVYPWPSTIYYEEANNKNYLIWKKFCENKCKKFYNFNNIFFELLEKSSKNKIIEDYFIKGDVHYNHNGSKLIANELYKEFKN